MNCLGLCSSDEKQNAFDVECNKVGDTAAIETQTSAHEVSEPIPNTLVIVDCGSSRLRAGFAGDETPSITIPTVVGKSIVDDVARKVFGSAALANYNSYKLTYPVQRGIITDWHDIEDLFEYIIDSHLGIQPKMHHIIITEALNNSFTNREKMAEMIFEKFEFNSFVLMASTPMAMYGYGATTGVMVESGAGQTHIVAIKDADCIRDSYRNIPIGGNDLTNYMGHLLAHTGKAHYFHGKRNAYEILDEIKQIGCHIVINYDEEVRKLQMNPDFVPKYVALHDGTMIGMQAEAFQAPELLFKPQLVGIQSGGIPQNIYECIESCDPSLKAELYENICVSGGNTMFDGIEDRLLWELKSFAGPNVNVKINVPPNRDNFVFLGTSLVGACPNIRDNLISYPEYQEVGPEIVFLEYN